MARNIQQIFNKVIKDGFYPGETLHTVGMCISLVKAQRKGSITSLDMAKADDAIFLYMKGTGYAYLSAALKVSGLPHDVDATLAIYKAWKRRPLLTCTIE